MGVRKLTSVCHYAIIRYYAHAIVHINISVGIGERVDTYIVFAITLTSKVIKNMGVRYMHIGPDAGHAMLVQCVSKWRKCTGFKL